jgi:tRNA modification GTPase
MRSLTRDTIAAIATAQGESGIAIVRVSGPGALKALQAVFTRQSSKQEGAGEEDGQAEARTAFALQADFARQSQKESRADWTPNRLYYGHVVENGQPVDEAMAVYMRAPRSYTCEDVAEIHCHGGRYAAEKTLTLILKQGVRAAGPGEFTLRAFVNGRIDLSQAEAVMGMISAGSVAAARAAARQMDGALGRFVDDAAEKLTGMLSLIEAGVDFPEEVDEQATTEALKNDIEAMIEALNAAADEKAAKIVRDGLTVAIAGAPNAGKSSLMNAMLQSDRAIVTDVPGTTRDVLSERLRVNGLDMTLMDTAGLRDAADAIEREGVARAKRAMDSADVVLLVLDGSVPEGEAEKLLINQADERFLLALNKCDLGVFPGRKGLPVSAKTGTGVSQLLEEISKRAGAYTAAEQRLTQPRHIDCVKRAVSALTRSLDGLRDGAPPDLITIDLMDALDSLLEITGQSASEAVIDAVFRNFCVGK